VSLVDYAGIGNALFEPILQCVSRYTAAGLVSYMKLFQIPLTALTKYIVLDVGPPQCCDESPTHDVVHAALPSMLVSMCL